MDGRFNEENIQATTTFAFKLAEERMKDEDDKKILQELRNIVGIIEKNFYRSQPRFQEAMFFPNMDNIVKLQKYIGMAKKSIDLAIFSFTND
jgi:hypothetical protein